ncbi:hypothetical protein EJB05_43933, partial [Eragrostis curvula]
MHQPQVPSLQQENFAATPHAAAAAPKKKRNQSGNPNSRMYSSRSQCGSDCTVAADAVSDEPLRVRGVQQGVPVRAEPATAPSRSQPSLEAEVEEPQREQGQGVPVPGANVRAPRPVACVGDLTGIKKHYCHKHGEKKWKCNKHYAVQSDWKAH